MKKVILIVVLLFTFISSEVLAEKVYKIYGERETDTIKEKCLGFCEGEKLKLTIAASVQKTKRIINGKRKNAPKWVTYNGIHVPKTACIPFLSWHERIIPIKWKKSEQEKYMMDFKEGTDMYNAHYEINTCMPCPPKVKSKRNKSGFCAVPMFYLDIVFKQAFDFGFLEPTDLSVYKIGREITGDIGINLKNALSGIVYEQLTLAESLKSDIAFLRFIEKTSNERFYAYFRITYKTTAKQQAIKMTDRQLLMDEDLAIYLDDFIYNFQKSYSEVFNMKGKDFENFSKLYDLIPTNEDINLLKKNFPKAVKFHIQTRN